MTGPDQTAFLLLPHSKSCACDFVKWIQVNVNCSRVHASQLSLKTSSRSPFLSGPTLYFLFVEQEELAFSPRRYAVK